MEKRISILGGDLRIVNLAKMLLKDGFEIYTFALEKSQELQEMEPIHFCSSLQELMKQSNTILTAIPLSKDGTVVNTPYSDSVVTIEAFYQNSKGKRIISGKLEESFKEDETTEVYDILEEEEYAIFNAIATAEGAIQVAMEEFPKTLSGSNILVLGFGRIGKIVAKMLQGIGAKVYCEARKKEDLAYIQAFGYTPIDLQDLNENLAKFDIIINNIPTLILDKTRLDLLKKEVLIIDLASKPGGVDFAYAKQQNIKTIWALALPGKVAPVSAAEYIKKVLYHKIQR